MKSVITVILPTLLVLSGCSSSPTTLYGPPYYTPAKAAGNKPTSQKFNVDFDEKTDFSRFKSYAWRPGTPARDPFMQEIIESAVEDQLQTKGLTKAISTPDIYIVTYAATKEKKIYTNVNLGYGDELDQKQMSEVIDVGTLRVDLVDAKSNYAVWRAVATKTLSDNPEKTKKLIAKETAKMFKHYPPDAKRAAESSGDDKSIDGQECIPVFCRVDDAAAYDPRYCCVDGPQD